MYSDASRNFMKGFGALCQKDWTFSRWDEFFMMKNQPSIEYLKLYAVIVAVLLWIDRFKNHKIRLFCDNKSIVHMLNSSSSSCKNCMVLIRIITLESMVKNVRVYAKHVTSKMNGKSDALSRLDFDLISGG